MTLALVLHLGLTLKNVESGFLAGHEFRQAQTGLSIKFIQQDEDYSLAYPTPLFGPPWSIPMEFPLYQWTAAWLVTHFDFTTALSGRVVSIVCFYLGLPAVVLLLRSAKMRWDAVNGVLILILTAPVYIYYTRAVLIESTALCLSLWFLYGFVRLCRAPHWGWCLLTAAFGSLAAMVKVTTFMVWGSGALAGGIWWYLNIRRTQGVRRANRFLYGAGLSAIPPMVAGIWWVLTADQIKLHAPDGQFLSSHNLREFNLGTWRARIDSDLWNSLIQHFNTALFPIWVLGGLGLAGALLGSIRRSFMPLILTIWAIAVWLAFPILYSAHDYYFYAMALLPLLAIGFAVNEIGQNGKGRLLAQLVVLTVSGIQLKGYFEQYAPSQFLVSNGGSQMEIFVRETFPTEPAVLVLGYDWTPILAYHMERRCLMIRDSVAQNSATLNTLLSKWDDVPVAGLLVANAYRTNTALISKLANRFNLETSIIVSDGNADLRVSRKLRYRLEAHLSRYPDNHRLERPAGVESLTPPASNTDPIIADGNEHPVTLNQATSVFYLVHPSPTRYRTQFGIGTSLGPEGWVMVAHPESDFWVEVPSSASEVIAEFGLQEDVYQDPMAHSDGVNFQIWTQNSKGDETLLFEKYADPFTNVDDRGKITISLKLPSPRPSQIRFSTRPGPNSAYDWSFWGNVIVQ